MRILLFILLFCYSPLGHTEDFVIYSVSHEVPMRKGQKTKNKNYYVNIGESQGVLKGSILQVYRSISRQDPYETKRRFNYKVPIGKLEVIHAENNAVIAIKSEHEATQILYEVNDFMIGDTVKVDVSAD